MRGDRVPITSLEFRDFWVLDISQPSHSTREAGGPSTGGVGVARTPSGEALPRLSSAMPSSTNPATSSCLRCFAHTILLEARPLLVAHARACRGAAAGDHVLSMPNVF